MYYFDVYIYMFYLSSRLIIMNSLHIYCRILTAIKINSQIPVSWTAWRVHMCDVQTKEIHLILNVDKVKKYNIPSLKHFYTSVYRLNKANIFGVQVRLLPLTPKSSFAGHLFLLLPRGISFYSYTSILTNAWMIFHVFTIDINIQWFDIISMCLPLNTQALENVYYIQKCECSTKNAWMPIMNAKIIWHPQRMNSP